MKRELKRHCFGISSAVGFINCKAYPDEKGIETKGDCMTLSPAQWNCKAYPDEKGIETDIVRHALAGDHIAKPIPMKRELKLPPATIFQLEQLNCKAYPDEKGIETVLSILDDVMELHCKAYPDEKGIETPFPCLCPFRWFRYCKAYPDEKGIETSGDFGPTAQELLHCKAYPDEKGIETPGGRPTGRRRLILQSLSR